MEIVELIKAIILGIIQGITEWLPVSSTGPHDPVRFLLAQWTASQFSGGRAFIDLFLVVIQFGSILAVLVLYFHKLNPFSPKKTPVEKRQTLSSGARCSLPPSPAGIVGLLFDDLINEYFYNAVGSGYYAHCLRCVLSCWWRAVAANRKSGPITSSTAKPCSSSACSRCWP